MSYDFSQLSVNDQKPQAESILQAFFKQNGEPHAAVSEVAQRYGFEKATVANLRSIIKQEPDVALPELYQILYNLHNGQLYLSQNQFVATMQDAYRVQAFTGSDGIVAGDGPDLNFDFDLGFGDDDDDSDSDNGGGNGGQPARQPAKAGLPVFPIAAILLVGLGALYYLSRT